MPLLVDRGEVEALIADAAMRVHMRPKIGQVMAASRDDYWAEPANFCRDVLGADPYDRQVEILESVRDNEQTSVVGANGTGKDWLTGRLVCWWLKARYPAKAIITGPTARQVADIVWREVRMAYRRSCLPLGGRMLPTEARWEIDDEHFALGFSTDKPWNLLGFHSPNLLIVVTEAHNFSDDDFLALKRLLPNRLLLTGNPFASSGEFYASHHDKRHLYRAISISALDSPNVQAGSEVVPGLITAADIERMARDWGEDNPLFRATVLGEFAQTEDGLLPLAWLQQARQRQAAPSEEPVEAGIDVAGPGEDETVVYLRQGPNVLGMRGWHLPDPRGELVAFLHEWKATLGPVKVDSAGIGYYLAQHLRDQGYRVVEVNVGEAPRNRERYVNLKADLYWGLHERFKAGDVTGLTDELTIGQLASIRYDHTSRGQIVIESKADARKRGVKSPDRAEAFMLAFANLAPDPIPKPSGRDSRWRPVAAAAGQQGDDDEPEDDEGGWSGRWR